ncbi:sorbosone dehydrogenase family protein [Flavobacterium sp. ASW18X]|uniref:PQQ-dependent sugar dehydrogenase n=1 Tax=Flavobacterium sp. ASW18X TaxID=2572595 RepID=UPI0010AEA09C|nr:PQQ-dependent sugar dehydrogenase [Flavobacterium sp. ASW18X]TKD66009.1 sorbosone dehydrogenase family protein [Flavobacterium sp. ASW18X]
MFLKNFKLLTIVALLASSFACKNQNKKATEVAVEEKPVYTSSLPLDSLVMPEGFKVHTFVENLDGARSMAMGDKGTLFVGTRTENKLYAVIDSDNDFVADRTIVLDTTLEVPNGIAFKNGALYVAEVNRLLRYDNIEERLDNPPKPVVIYDDYPDKFHHGWKYIAFGPDDKLYVPVGAPCNICDDTDKDERFATITRMDLDGSNREIVARGVRNTVGFTWHPDTDQLWFTDNGRDMMGDDVPPCELNKVTEIGAHFGYPFCHGGTIADPEFGAKRSCDEFVPPVQNLGAHVAPLAVKFVEGTMFPEKYQKQILIAEHGSWNRSEKSGYRITKVTLEGDKALKYEPFIEGWLNHENQTRWGRPVDMLFLKDGSLLISDDYGDAVYRIYVEEQS